MSYARKGRPRLHARLHRIHHEILTLAVKDPRVGPDVRPAPWSHPIANPEERGTVVRMRTLVGTATVVGAALLFRRWRQHSRVLREAQARGDRVEVIARLRTITTPQAEAHPTHDSAYVPPS
jgi:hypothetical protein